MSRRTGRNLAAFTLVELLIVVGIISVLVAILLPTLGKARRSAQRVACGSNLRQVGVALQNYVTESRGHLPWVEEPIWSPGFPGRNVDYTVDPMATLADGSKKYPFAFVNVMRPYLKDPRVMICPSALIGYPQAGPLVTYRVAAVNASDGKSLTSDGRPRTVETFAGPDGTYDYAFNFKYLNYRKHKLEWVNATTGVGRLERGVGLYYLARDFKIRNATVTDVSTDPKYGGTVAPHDRAYNRLRLDFSVSLDIDEGRLMAETYP